MIYARVEMLFSTILSFFVGLIVILASAQTFLNIAQELAVRWKFSPLIISLVIISFGTTLPELTVTLASIGSNDPGLAMGNIIGSSIANLTLVLGTATLFGAVRIGTTKTPKNATVLLVLTVMFTILSLSSVNTYYKVILLILGVTLSLIYQYILAVRGRSFEDKNLLELIQQVSKKKKYLPNFIYLLLFIISVIGLIFGGNITVKSVEDLSLLLGLSTTFLGLTLTSVTTSLPELLTTIIASNKKENKVVIGTLIGSNIYNISIFPAIILFSTTGYQIKKFVSIKELFFLLLVIVIFYSLIMKYKGTVIPKKISLLLLLLFPIFTLVMYYF